MMTFVLDLLRSEGGEVHPYVLFAGIVTVMMTAFISLAEIVSVDAAHSQVARALQSSLRGAARMQDFQQEGRVVRSAAQPGFGELLAANLALTSLGWSGETLFLQSDGRHPYIAGQVTADFVILDDGQRDTLIGRVRVPLRLPFLGPMFQKVYKHPVTVCEVLAVTPHDLYGGLDVDGIAIPPGMRC